MSKSQEAVDDGKTPSTPDETSINLQSARVSDHVLEESPVRFSSDPGDSDRKDECSVNNGKMNTLSNATCCLSNGKQANYSDVNTGNTVGLVYIGHERLRPKDFDSEVRGILDIEQFLSQSQVLLDITEVSLESLVEMMLERLVASDENLLSRLDEIRKGIFIPGSSSLVAKTIQGVQSECSEEVIRSGADLSYNPTWMIALCEINQLRKRHMIVARFKHPLNMGETATLVRVFVLIIAPSEEKGTKNALETGRTFATLLSDSRLFQSMLVAKNEIELKSLMMVRAQRLGKVDRVKHRHKYSWNAALEVHVSSLNSLNNNENNLAKKTVPTNSLSKIKLGKSDNSTSVCFNYNPRTCQLFDLVSQTTDTTFSSDKSILNGHDELSEAKHSKSFDLCKHVEFGKGLWEDFLIRAKCYGSDFVDAFVGPAKTLQKTIATVWFLYFGILLPTIAFSALNTEQTHGHMGDLKKAILGQAIGGLVFALLGGQPLVIIMTTAPLCLYTKVVHQMCLDYDFHFPSMYAAVGLWNGFFLIIYSLFGFSRLMKWCTRSTEEVFALFIVVAFIMDACKDMMKNFNRFYYSPACEAINSTSLLESNQTNQFSSIANSSSVDNLQSDLEDSSICRRETSILFVLLMLGTLWLGTTLLRFKKTPYLGATLREFLADYALPLAVIALSFVGSFVFNDIYVEKFPPVQEIQFRRAPVELLSVAGILISAGLGFTLSLLFFMDQNISAAMVNAPQNGLKKAPAYHFDLMVIAILNGFLSLYGLPMMHGVLPHSPLHVRNLADIEHKVVDGHLQEVISNVRETRVTGVLSHILILASLYLIPYPIAYIPKAVLNGLFLYMAATSLDGLQMFERILLIFTEQRKYPPNHYIRKCPQAEIHKFTLVQLFQLVILCLLGFSPYNIIEMFFPVIILLMIPFRHNIVTKLIDRKYLDTLDGKGH